MPLRDHLARAGHGVGIRDVPGLNVRRTRGCCAPGDVGRRSTGGRDQFARTDRDQVARALTDACRSGWKPATVRRARRVPPAFTARQKPATAARQNRPPFQSRSPTRSPDRQPQAHAAITATTKNPVGCHHPPGSSDAVVVVVGQAVGCRSDGPSMRSVVHRCRRRSSNAPTISLRPRNEYQSSYSRFVVKIVDFRL